MAWLGGRKPAEPLERPLRSLEVGAADLEHAARLLDLVEQAYNSNDAQVRGAARALAVGAGALEPEVVVRRGLSPQETHRPWRWLARVAQVAQAKGDDVLPGRVFLFLAFWSRTDGHRTMGDYFDTLLDTAPADSRAQITTLAIESLSRLDPGAPVTVAAADPFQAGPVLEMARAAMAP